MVSNNNLKNMLTNLFSKSKQETDKQYEFLNNNMNKGWISSGTIENIEVDKVNEVSPVGNIIAIMGNEAPINYLICDGTEYNIEEYSELANYFNTQFGKVNQFGGDGITTFKVPDLRGEFLRGSGTNSHTNSGNGATVGAHQAATLIPRVFVYSDGSLYLKRDYTSSSIYEAQSDSQIYSSVNNPISTQYKYASQYNDTAAQEEYYTSRPTNTSVLYCIKYRSTHNLSINMYDGTHYSNDELLIGQWVDGKPLYRKCFKIDKITNNNGVQYIDVADLNIEYVVNWNGFVDQNVSAGGGANQAIPINTNMNDGYYISTTLNDYKNKIILVLHWGTSKTTLSGYITIEYTKTTDEPYSVDEDIAWVALESDVNDVLNNIGE